MRKPPDKPHVSALSERDVDTSNATLNTLLGGSHQKSWMMGGMGTPVRATPRRTPSVTAAQTTTAVTSPLPQPRPRIPISQPVRKIMAPVLPSPTPSDEPRHDPIPLYTSNEHNPSRPANTESSIPRNASKSPVRQRSGSLISALPRMRPANATSSRPAMEPVLEPNTAQRRESWDLTEDEPDSILPAQGHVVESPTVLPNGGPHREVNMESNGEHNEDLDGELSGMQISREETRSNLQFLQSPSPDIVSPVLAQATLPRHTPNGIMPFSNVQLSNTQSVSHPIYQRAGQSVEAANSVQTDRVAPRLPGPPIPSPTLAISNGRAENNYDRPSLPAQPLVPGPAHSINPPKRQRTQPPVMPSLAPRVALIEAHIASVGGEMNLNTGLERPRFSLLKDACTKEDGFYVATHQIFCAWDFNPQQVLDIVGFPSLETLKVAFKILGQLIRDNAQLAPNHLAWFAKFPSPLPDLLGTSEPYRRTVNSVGVFLARLGVDWLQFANDTRARSYPPLVDELVNRLGILSPIFQGIVFTATRRNLGVVDDAAGDQMEKMFLKDRQEHQALAARVNTNRPPTEQEISNRNSKLAAEYYSLLRQVRLRQSSVASSGGSLTRAPTPGNAYLPPGSSPGMNPSIQRLQQPSSFLGNPGSASASPDVIVNGRQDVIGPPWRTSAASPNMVVAPDFGRPSAMNSPQMSLQANSPSPHTIQNAQFQAQQPVLRSNGSSMQNVQQWESSGPSQVANQGFALSGEQYPQNQHQPAPQVSSQAMPGQYQRNPPTQQHPPTNGESLMTQLNNIAQELFFITDTRQQRSGFSGQDPPQYEQSIRQREQYLLQQQAQLQQALAVSRTTGPPMNSSYRTSHQPQPQPSSVYTQYSQASQAMAPQPYAGGSGPGPPPHVSQYPPPNPQAPQNFNYMPHQRNGSGSAAPRPRGRLQATDVRLVSNPGPGYLPQPMNPTGQPHPVISEGALRMLNQTEAYNATPIQNQSVVPPYYYPLPPGLPAPHFTALHQAHLRSPLLVPCKPVPKDVPLDDTSRRFYQVVKEFACAPVKLLATQAIATFEFTVLQEYFPMIARSLPLSGRSPETRGYVEGSLQYRMRCVERKGSDGHFPMSEWSLQETSWPDNGVYQLEAGMTKQQIELRRKRLHGKDLPVDLTAYVVLFQPTVDIKITMSMPGRRNNLREKNYYFAVEIIEMMAHSQIMDSVQRRRQAAQITRESIRKSLAGPDLDDGDDDDIALVSSELTLDITDPFSARMFTIPVRSSNCHHRECFDLETYLLSRNSKPNRKGQPSMVDIWKCPLCKVDARPQTLYVDEYLVDIRNAVEEKGERDVKAVLVDMSGGWKVKELPVSNNNAGGSGGGGQKRKMMHDEEDSEDEEDDIPVSRGRNHVRTKSLTAAAAVIDLSD